MAAVPNDLGVPPLLTGMLPSTTATLLTGDTVSGLGQSTAPKWGIFSGGSAVITADTVTSLDYKQEWVIADFPLEGGAFSSYDKVSLPYDARVRFVAGKSDQNRQALLSSVAGIAGDLKLYDVVTPEATYTSCNVRHYDYHRTTTNGLGVIAVDVWLLQIRTSGTQANSTAAPSGAGQINGGTVQAGAANGAQATAGAGFQ